MFRNYRRIGIGLTLAVMLIGSSDRAWSRDFRCGRLQFGGCGLGVLVRSPNGSTGQQACTTTGQPKRYYDSTGRWTGDGVDTMATGPRR